MSIFDRFDQSLPKSWSLRGLSPAINPPATQIIKRKSAKAGVDIKTFFGAMLAALVLSSPAYAERSRKVESVRNSIITDRVLVSGSSEAFFNSAKFSLPTSFLIAQTEFSAANDSVEGENVANASMPATDFQRDISVGFLQVEEIASKNSFAPPISSVDISSHTQQFITKRGFARLVEFGKAKSGWDRGKGQSLNLESVAEMDIFIHGLKFKPDRVSVFMSHAGNVVVSWPEPEEGLIELEFLAGAVSYFVESLDEERKVLRSMYPILREKLSDIEAAYA